MKHECWREETIFLIVEFLLILLIFTFTIIVEFHVISSWEENILVKNIYRKCLLTKRKCWREETNFIIVEFLLILLIFTFTIIVEFHVISS